VNLNPGRYILLAVATWLLQLGCHNQLIKLEQDLFHIAIT
jgi:hypothetical protein